MHAQANQASVSAHKTLKAYTKSLGSYTITPAILAAQKALNAASQHADLAQSRLDDAILHGTPRDIQLAQSNLEDAKIKLQQAIDTLDGFYKGMVGHIRRAILAAQEERKAAKKLLDDAAVQVNTTLDSLANGGIRQQYAADAAQLVYHKALLTYQAAQQCVRRTFVAFQTPLDSDLFILTAFSTLQSDLAKLMTFYRHQNDMGTTLALEVFHDVPMAEQLVAFDPPMLTLTDLQSQEVLEKAIAKSTTRLQAANLKVVSDEILSSRAKGSDKVVADFQVTLSKTFVDLESQYLESAQQALENYMTRLAPYYTNPMTRLGAIKEDYRHVKTILKTGVKTIFHKLF